MLIQDPGYWDATPQAAIALQRELAHTVDHRDGFGALRRIAGIDAGFPADGTMTRVALVVMGFPGFEILERIVIEAPTRFPYVPGLLSFREVPVMLDALRRLAREPDLILVDGHGVAHPRRCGSASHLGLVSGIPTIGIGKRSLIGEHDEPGDTRGVWTPLVHQGERIGAAVRTRRRVSPVIVSTGHRVSLASAIEIVLDCAPRFRLPEPIRAADRLASGRA